MRLWAIGFLTGILLVQQFSNLPVVYWCTAGLLVFAVFIPFRTFRATSYSVVLVSGLAFGFAWALAHAHWMMEHRLIAQYEGIDLVIEGQIISLPVSPPKVAYSKGHKAKQYGFGQQRVRFDFRPSRIMRSNTKPENTALTIPLAQFPRRIRLSWYKPTTNVAAGQFWRFTVRLKRPHGLLNPGGFDYESSLFQKRIQARGTIRNNNSNQMVRVEDSSSIIITLMLELRQSILNRLSNDIDIGEHSEFIQHATQSLILGYRGGLSASQWQTLQRTGTIHLMAISGLHIGLVAALVYGLVSLLWRLSGRLCLFIPAPQMAAIAALLAAAIYAVLAGFTIPTQRALVMLLVAMLNIVLKRTPLPASKTIALALVSVLLLDPLAVLAQGFWLSFLAVSLIIYLAQQTNGQIVSNDIYEFTQDEIASNKSFIGLAAQKVGVTSYKFWKIQWALTVAMFPMVMFFYQSSSLVSPIANFVAIPVISLAVVPLMFIATALLFINTTIANLFFTIVDFIYSLLWQFLEMLAQWQYATVDFSIVSIWGMLFCYLAILLWLCVKGSPMRWLAMVLVLPVIFYSNLAIKEGEAVITVLDVGQGLSIVVQTKDHTVVFDTGPKYSENFDTGRAVVIPFLRRIRRSSIDTLIISHGDNDHIGGFNSIASMLPITRVLTSIPDSITFDSAALRNYEVSECHVGQQWHYDDVEFTIISPIEFSHADNGHDENNQSCVLKVTTQFGSVLITGDIERETESYLYHNLLKRLSAEVLIVPHHGSNTSSLAEFIKAVTPRYAVFTVGYKNRYRLPNQKVIHRYQQYSKAKLLRSDQTGALTFKLQQDIVLQPLSYREQARRYWHTTDITAF